MKRTLILGRFQPPHRGHLAVIRAAARDADEVIVVIGSAQESHTWDNPFSSSERARMLRAAVRESNLRNVKLVPVPDLHDHPNWVAHVERHVPPFHGIVTNNPLTRRLFREAGYPVRAGRLRDRTRLRGRTLRTRLARGLSIDDRVPPAVLQILDRLNARTRLAALAPAKPHARRH